MNKKSKLIAILSLIFCGKLMASGRSDESSETPVTKEFVVLDQRDIYETKWLPFDSTTSARSFFSALGLDGSKGISVYVFKNSRLNKKPKWIIKNDGDALGEDCVGEVKSWSSVPLLKIDVSRGRSFFRC